MRISDWSSDVCSSDLSRFVEILYFDEHKVRFARVSEFRHAAFANARSADGDIGTFTGAIDARKASDVADSGFDDVVENAAGVDGGQLVHVAANDERRFGDRSDKAVCQAGEIGRAAGRERVGQYV